MVRKRLKEYRDGLAKELNLKRNEINKDLADTLESLKGKQGGEIEKARKHAENNAKIRRAWNILNTHDNARRGRFDEEFKSIGREFKVEKSIKKHEELAAKLRAKKAVGEKLKKAGKIAAGTALAAGLVYGGKKLYNKYKNKDMKEQKEFARTDYEGLNFIDTFKKNYKRNRVAQELKKQRNQINKELEENLKYNASRAKKIANLKRTKALDSISFGETMENLLNSVGSSKKKPMINLKKAGKIAAGTALAAGLVYGGKKLYNKYKNKDMKEQKEFARTVYETEPKNVPMETPKVAKEKASKLRDIFNRTKESIKNSKAGKNAAEFYAKHEKGVKIGGGVAAGTALAAGLAVGAKKLADKKKEQQKEFARADYEGLNFIDTFKKNYKRNRVAQELKKQRNQINKELEENLKYNASRAKKIANLKRTKALDSISFGETMENLLNSVGSSKKKPMINLKKAGYAGLGVAGAAGLAYGGKKLYDKYKKNNESDNKD